MQLMKSYSPGVAICGPPMCFVQYTQIFVILYHSSWCKKYLLHNIYKILSEYLISMTNEQI
jgi:hypothetical protein